VNPSTTARPDLTDAPRLPEELRPFLEELQQDLTRAAGDNLAGLIVFGSAIRGGYRKGTSDVNLVVLLRDTSAPKLRDIAPAIKRAWRALRVEPLLLKPSEVAEATDVFPTRFLDIQRHHLVLTGEDPFHDLRVSPEHIRLRVEQELRNLLLRLRRRYIALVEEPATLSAQLVSITSPLLVELETLLRLTNQPIPPGGEAALIQAAAQAFALDGPALLQLLSLKAGTAELDEPEALIERVLANLDSAARVAHELEGRL
jgi:predicted nucleotidyltransferase